MTFDKWLSRALVASFLVNCLLAVWLWSASRKPENIERATHEYQTARTVYDTTRVVQREAVRQLREARQTLKVTDTIKVREYIALTDSVLVADSVALAAADTALAKADALIRELRGKKPRLIQPFAEILYSPYSRQYVGRLGVGANISRRLSLVVAGEARRDGPQAYIGARWSF